MKCELNAFIGWSLLAKVREGESRLCHLMALFLDLAQVLLWNVVSPARKEKGNFSETSLKYRAGYFNFRREILLGHPVCGAKCNIIVT